MTDRDGCMHGVRALDCLPGDAAMMA